MALTTARSSITRLLRAAISPRTVTTTLPRLHHNLYRPLHTFAPASPLSFLRSRPTNLPISNHHFFSTYLPWYCPPFSGVGVLGFLISTTTLILLGTGLVLSTTVLIAALWLKIASSDDKKAGSELKESSPDGFRKEEESVVFGGYFKLMQLLLVVMVLLLPKYFG